jgi:ABC-type lipoprotein release transport system permease subunit
MADGALVTLEASDRRNFDELSGASWTTVAVRFADAADQEASLDRLARPDRRDVTTATRPQEIDQLRQVRTLPRVLAAFLFLVALLAVGHALTVTVRQRRRDLATVRSLGATPIQARGAIAWQASILCTAGAIVGLPVGVLLGRVLWAVLARSYGVSDSVAVPAVVLFGVLPVSVLLANLLAYLPGRRAATLRPALFLGGE